MVLVILESAQVFLLACFNHQRDYESSTFAIAQYATIRRPQVSSRKEYVYVCVCVCVWSAKKEINPRVVLKAYLRAEIANFIVVN